MNFLKKVKQLFEEKLWFKITLIVICTICFPLVLLFLFFHLTHDVIESLLWDLT